MRPLFIFDLDGTLALTEHRQHHLQGERKDWRAFFAACVNDQPAEAVVRTMQLLEVAGAEVWIWSGRSDEVRAETIAWLRAHGIADLRLSGIQGHAFRFRMRAAEDRRADHDLKAEWLGDLEPQDRDRLVAIFDDRDTVVAAWRAAGVPCFQVAPGDF